MYIKYLTRKNITVDLFKMIFFKGTCSSYLLYYKATRWKTNTFSDKSNVILSLLFIYKGSQSEGSIRFSTFGAKIEATRALSIFVSGFLSLSWDTSKQAFEMPFFSCKT